MISWLISRNITLKSCNDLFYNQDEKYNNDLFYNQDEKYNNDNKYKRKEISRGTEAMVITSIVFTNVILFVVSLALIFQQTQITDSIVYAESPQPQLQYGVNTSDPGGENILSSQQLPIETASSILNNIFRQTEDSVVLITTAVPQPGIVQDPSQENRTALGSGFLFDKEGHIITNNHVVGDAKIVDVTFTNGDRLRANVTAIDPYIDIAVLRIIETQNNTIPQGHDLNALQFGNSSALLVGDTVIAIGNPYGLAGTMTTGIVSQVGRLVPAPGVGFSVPDVIQTDAAISPGNSGGPLLNLQGQVIGVNFAALPGGLGFAIPTNLIQKVVPILIEKGNYTHPYLGFTSDLAATIENITQNVKGVAVNTLVEGGPADKAGLQGTTIDQYGRKRGGDVIVAIDGDKIREFEQLVSYLEENKIPGDTIVLNVFRNGNMLELEAVLGERPLPSSLHVPS
ncbi:MAG: PDZ domain-containing protein [Nitrososphaeraceae archaeon]|nr:PDZ domain-containing protein [Nitrososphaeraceae archaeon]